MKLGNNGLNLIEATKLVLFEPSASPGDEAQGIRSLYLKSNLSFWREIYSLLKINFGQFNFFMKGCPNLERSEKVLRNF